MHIRTLARLLHTTHCTVSSRQDINQGPIHAHGTAHHGEPKIEKARHVTANLEPPPSLAALAFCIESYATLRGVCSPKKRLGPVSF